MNVLRNANTSIGNKHRRFRAKAFQLEFIYCILYMCGFYCSVVFFYFIFYVTVLAVQCCVLA